MAVKIVNFDDCTGCGACVDTCPNEVLELKDDKVSIVNLDDCVECGACVDACPNEVLELEEEE